MINIELWLSPLLKEEFVEYLTGEEVSSLAVALSGWVASAFAGCT